MRIASLSLLMCLGTLGMSAVHAQPMPGCDRYCLINQMDNYLYALVAHDTDYVHFDENTRFVENIERLQPGEGLWQSATAGPTDFRIHVPDPVSGQVGFMGMMEENGAPVLVAIRLKIVDGRVQEAEHLIARNLSERNLGYLQTLRPGITEPIPEEARQQRHELLGIAYSYYDAVDYNNGALAPMSVDGCSRRENGSPSANSGLSDAETDERPNYSALDCVAQLNTGMMAYIDSIDNVRVPIVDPETGLAFGLSHFRHAMQIKEYPIYNMPGVTTRTMNANPFDLPAAHVFKIRSGEIHEIEAMGFVAPYNAPTGWEREDVREE